MKIKIVIHVTAALTLIPAIALAETKWLNKTLEAIKTKSTSTITQTKLSDTKIGAGLKEALKVGINNAVKSTGKTDGFFKNQAIKILMPEKLAAVEKGLRMIGMGPKIDEFVLSMNRAAEKASPSAQNIFIDTIFNMNFDDIQKIYKGGDQAATNFLKEKTYSKLKETFTPFVNKTLDEYQVTKSYKDLVAQYQKIPLAQKPGIPDINDYVISKTLNGLFAVLGQEEGKIRKDPTARITPLLKEIFQ
jgi:hypothetical protein